MNRYECSGCGKMSCEGQCFTESRSDYETPQEAHKRRVKFWADIEAKELIASRAEQFTVCAGDPLLPKNRRAA